MPDNAVKFSDLTAVGSLTENDIFAVAAVDNDSPTGYTSYYATMQNISAKTVLSTTFSNLKTTSKFVEGAINELYGLVLTTTLTAGTTTVTFSDASITTDSTLDDIWTSVFGLFPTNAVFATGSLTLTFSAQASDIGVKVRII